jgi:hypothetical protein
MPIFNIEPGILFRFLITIFITCIAPLSHPAYALEAKAQSQGGSFSVLHAKQHNRAQHNNVVINPCSQSDRLTTQHSGFSLVSEDKSDCLPDPPPPHTTATRVPKPNSEPFRPEFVQTQMAGIAAIHFGRVYGGTTFLSNLWYTGALVIPHFMERDEVYGIGKNYLAVTPPFLALGLLNKYLSNDGATEGRIFFSNLIGFNLALLWKDKILSEPQHFLNRLSDAKSALTASTKLQPYVSLSHDGPLVGIHFAW